jgi:hypothetical protein
MISYPVIQVLWIVETAQQAEGKTNIPTISRVIIPHVGTLRKQLATMAVRQRQYCLISTPY